MKKIFLLLPAIIFFVNGFSQIPNWVWARSVGAVSNDYSNATCIDANGNVYITGTFQGSSITFGSYTLNNVGTGSLDIFIVKYDAGGNVLWAKSGDGINSDFAYGICSDANGNIYITGYFSSPSLTFGTIHIINSDSSGNSDIFITKYDPLGNEQWSHSVGSKFGWDASFGICTDADSNVYITGMFSSDTLVFGNVNLIKRGSYDIFIAKYDAGGNVLWAKSAGGIQQDAGFGICTDSNRNVYVTGYFQYHAFFGSDTLIGNSYVNMFVAKYDSSGNKLWTKKADGTISAAYDIGTGITADVGGNVYITGYFRNSICLGNDTLGNAGANSIFVAKYDSSGNALWGRGPGGTGSDYGAGIAADINSNIFVTGYFSSSFLNFGGIPILNANVGYTDIFVAKYDAGGNALWATNIGGPDYDYGMGLCTSIGDVVYVTGYFGSYTTNFGSTTLTNNGSYDIFLAKLNGVTGIEENDFQNSLSLFPNPATHEIKIQSGNVKVESIEIFNVMGEKCLTLPFDFAQGDARIIVSSLSAGIYFVRVRGEKTEWSGKFVKTN